MIGPASIDDRLIVLPPDLDLDSALAIRDTEMVIMGRRRTIGDIALVIDADVTNRRRFGFGYPYLAALGLEVRGAVALVDGDADLYVIEHDRLAFNTAISGLVVDGLQFGANLYRGWR